MADDQMDTTPSARDIETKVKPKVLAAAKRKSPKVKAQRGSGSNEEWEPSDYFRNSPWFATNISLPNRGDIPHKIGYVTEDMLHSCFGESSWNGYKLSNCTGIPIEEVLALWQVVDG
jgi:hypothetical protein